MLERAIAIEFGDRIRAMSIFNFGESADPSSPYDFNKAKLYGNARFKPAWFTDQEVRARAVRTYRPGR